MLRDHRSWVHWVQKLLLLKDYRSSTQKLTDHNHNSTRESYYTNVNCPRYGDNFDSPLTATTDGSIVQIKNIVVFFVKCDDNFSH